MMPEDTYLELKAIVQKTYESVVSLTSNMSALEIELKHRPDGSEVHDMIDKKISQHVQEKHSTRSMNPPIIIKDAPVTAPWYSKVNWAAVVKLVLTAAAGAGLLKGLETLPM